MTDALSNLEKECPRCGRVSGDHTLREWSKCLGAPTMMLPYEPTPDDAAEVINAALREQFELGDDTIVADNVVIRAATLQGESGTIGVTLPALFHEFQVGVAGHPPTTVCKVVFIGSVESVRAYGRLARDSANGAANRAEGR